ncbi:MAG: 16S rRNA (cytosine1402-N4)-methyltransferase [Cellvibrionaceae bacterium]|jgi:16S rRNA (cytosine1402-N4)-methyltransferase
MANPGEHVTVLLDEAVESLITDLDGFYVDGTFGRGGHSAKVLGGLSEGGRLLAIDKDEQAVAVGSLRFMNDDRFDLVQGSFAGMRSYVEGRGQLGKVSGILLDLGVSSPQLDQAERGFSFLHDGPLDMRMDTTTGLTAADWVNRAEESEIIRVLKEYGEERFARRMARAILSERSQEPIITTARLAKIVAEANPAWEKGKHPATRAFQAIRIHINNELGDLDQVLSQSLDILAVGGRLVVISFHSLEDRRAKRFIQRYEKGDEMPMGLPITADKLNKRLKRIGKFVKSGKAELELNPRARSAVMRVAEKIA